MFCSFDCHWNTRFNCSCLKYLSQHCLYHSRKYTSRVVFSFGLISAYLYVDSKSPTAVWQYSTVVRKSSQGRCLYLPGLANISTKQKNLIISPDSFHTSCRKTASIPGKGESCTAKALDILVLTHQHIATILAIFTEKQEGLKDNLDITLQRFRGLRKKCSWCHRLKRIVRNHFDSE